MNRILPYDKDIHVGRIVSSCGKQQQEIVVDDLVTIATDWMASETERDARLHEIGRAWCALMGEGDVGGIEATVEELVRRTGEKEWDVYSRMLNVALVYMHSLVSGIVVKNGAGGCSCGCAEDESVCNTIP